MVPHYSAALKAHHLISDDGCGRLLEGSDWVYVDRDTVDARNRERGQILRFLEQAARSRTTYLNCRIANDSLQRIKTLKFETRPTARLLEQVWDRLWVVDEDKDRSTGRIKEQAWQFDMEWMRMNLPAHERFVHLENESRMFNASIDSIPLRTLVADLLEIGLVDSILALYIASAVEQGCIEDPGSLFSAASQVGHLPDMRKRREKDKLIVQMLVDLGAMSGDQAKVLGQYADPYEVRIDADIATACYRSWPMDSSVWYSNDVVNYCRNAFKGLRSLFGDLLQEDLMISTDTVEWVDVYGSDTSRSKSVNVRLSFMAGDRLYQNSAYCRIRSIEGHVYIDMPRVPLVTCINKALCDQGSAERVWQLPCWRRPGPCSEWGETGEVFMSVDRKIAEAWSSLRDRSLDTLDGSWYSFPNRWCAEEIRGGVEDFRAAGVLAHLSPAAIDSAEAVANGTIRTSWAEVFSAFPEVLLDRRGLRTQAVGLYSLARISHGVLDPIEERRKRLWGREHLVSLSFTIGGKRYKCSDKSGSMGMTMNHELALKSASIRLCTMPWGDSQAVLFLTKPQYDALHDKYLSDYFGAWEDLPKD